MEKKLTLKTTDDTAANLYISNCGIHITKPCEKFGPASRPHYMLVYVLEGTGLFASKGVKYSLKKYDGFLITPNELACFESDKKDPWTYLSVSFNGNNMAELLESFGLSSETPFFKSSKSDEIHHIITEMAENKTFAFDAELKRSSLFYSFLSIIAENYSNETNRSLNYVNKAIKYMYGNYSNPIKITDVSDYVCINRSYLYTLFMNEMGTSPHQFLSDIRLNKACELLLNTNFPVESIALSCGYMDSLVFTKAFKQVKKLSPSAYRKNNR